MRRIGRTIGALVAAAGFLWSFYWFLQFIQIGFSNDQAAVIAVFTNFVLGIPVAGLGSWIYEELKPPPPAPSHQSIVIQGPGVVVQQGGRIGGGVQQRMEVNGADLAADLARLREVLAERASEPADHTALSQIAVAEAAAQTGDSRRVTAALAAAGRRALEAAVDIGASVAAAALRKALGL